MGAPIITVVAKDADSGTFGKIIYVLSSSGNNNEQFRINNDTGVIYLNKRLDEVAVKSYMLQVRTHDGGSLSSNKGITYIQIKVSDVNDNQPVFTTSYQAIDIFENLPVGSNIGVAHATDADASFNHITYSIVQKMG